jgi:hypothetical protein
MTNMIKTSHLITLNYYDYYDYDITSQYIRFSENNDERRNIPIHTKK